MDKTLKLVTTAFVLLLLAAVLLVEYSQSEGDLGEDFEGLQDRSCAEQYRWVGDGTIDLEDVSSRCLADEHDPEEMGEEVTTREEAFRRDIQEALEEAD